jgi:hypothetical protein
MSSVPSELNRHADPPSSSGDEGSATAEPRRCASCGGADYLVVDDTSADTGVLFCRGCLDQVTAIEFPQYYRDLGGGD